jgi:16S rRNA (guanine(966)-N(2))-methyltransferase RsmD
MRVIGGEFRSRRLKTLPGVETRPTPDRLRETLFDILAPRISGSIFLDAYAGAGAVGIEALSRGAAQAIFLEKNRAAVNLIQENLAALGLESRARVVPGPVTAALRRYSPDIAFLDPPYGLESEYESALEILGERPPALVIVQHAKRFRLNDSYGRLRRTRILTQGDNALSFYAP